MKTLLLSRGFHARFASLLSLVSLLGLVNVGCGKKAADTAVPFANSKNPAAVAPAPVSGSAPGARGGSPEAEAYRQKMGANAKPIGAR